MKGKPVPSRIGLWWTFVVVLVLHPLASVALITGGIHRHSPTWYLKAEDIVATILWFPTRLTYPLWQVVLGSEKISFMRSVIGLIAEEIFDVLVWGTVVRFLVSAVKRLTKRRSAI